MSRQSIVRLSIISTVIFLMLMTGCTVKSEPDPKGWFGSWFSGKKETRSLGWECEDTKKFDSKKLLEKITVQKGRTQSDSLRIQMPEKTCTINHEQTK